MRAYVYNLEIVTEGYVPSDVLIEHLAVAMRDFRFLGKNGITLLSAGTIDVEEPKVARQHPFDGPEVFDDKPRLEDSFPEDPFPLTTQVIDRLKETRRHGND